MPAVCPTSQTDHLWSSALRWHLPCAAGTVAIKASQRRQVNQGILPMTCPRTVSTSSEELGTMGSLHRSDWYTKFQAICGKVRHIHSISLVGGPPGSRSRHLGIVSRMSRDVSQCPNLLAGRSCVSANIFRSHLPFEFVARQLARQRFFQGRRDYSVSGG